MHFKIKRKSPLNFNVAVIVITTLLISLSAGIVLKNYEGENDISDINSSIAQGQELKLSSKVEAVMSDETIKEVEVKSDKIGYVQKVYEKGQKRYLQIDEVQFLTGNAAVEAAKEDGNAGYDEDTKKYFVYNDYYIVNSNPRLGDYEVPSTASVNMLGFLVNPMENDSSNQQVSYDQFETFINTRNSSNNSDRTTLCRIYIENDVVVKIEGVFTP